MAIVNPAGKSDYFDTAGNTITAGTQPDVNSGAIAGVLTTSLDSTMFVGKSPGDPIIQGPSVIVAVSGNDYFVGALVGGNPIGFNAGEGQYIIRGYTTQIQGTGNTLLRSPAADPANRRPVHFNETYRLEAIATAISSGLWHETSGVFNSPGPQSREDNFGQDDAGRPSATVPGELVFAYGGISKTSGEYENKTQWG
jgi:hypothetical protein